MLLGLRRERAAFAMAIARLGHDRAASNAPGAEQPGQRGAEPLMVSKLPWFVAAVDAEPADAMEVFAASVLPVVSELRRSFEDDRRATLGALATAGAVRRPTALSFTTVLP